MKTLICDCNQTMPLDAVALRQALARTPGADAVGLGAPHTGLCRREAGAFQRAAKETAASAEPLLVACTQESRLFLDLNAQTEGSAGVEVRPIRFVNLRETGGWSRDAAGATPKLAALIAQAQRPEPDPVPTVSYRSAGRVLVIGAADAAGQAAALLQDKLDVHLLVDRPGGTLAQAHEIAVHTGQLQSLRGWLGAFDAAWTSANPIDLDVCTRCNACIAACPEGAIDFSYQVDLARCQSHRSCVTACDAAGAIDFDRAPLRTEERFDLVLDLRAAPAFPQHQPPQGYWHVGSGTDDPQRLVKAVLELRERVGEFEKPKFFGYRESLCAHSRNQQIGCNACIDVCSAQAIRSNASLKGKTMGKHRGVPAASQVAAGTGHSGPAVNVAGQGGGVVVEPHLCVGCGACSTVCPSGAMSFAYPGPAHTGGRLRSMLTAYAQAGGRDAALLIHSEGAGQRLIDALGRAAQASRPAPARPAGGSLLNRLAAAVPGRAEASPAAKAGLHGVPARVLPVAVWHTASLGLELWLAAIAQGASQVLVLLTDEEAPDYRRALQDQMAAGQAILSGLGYAGLHLQLMEATDAASLDAALRGLTPAQTVAQAAGFAAGADKRGTLDMALDHLLAQAPAVVDEITLPAAGSPLGSLAVNADACTLCLSCVGACPAGALADNPDKPQLKFIEKNCVQCGLCATTCPEQAITLQPRLWLADGGKARKQSRVLHEVAPFACIRCAKPFGTLKAIEGMLAKLAGHPAFQGAAADRLKMCGDCRVIDIHTNPAEVRITDPGLK